MAWTVEEIINAFDSNPNMTLQELSRCCMWSVKELKTLLMGY